MCRSRDGEFTLHVFHKNNELAGYCSVLHALELIGITGDYGRHLRAAVIGFEATGQGAVTALNAHGVNDVDVLTQRGVTAVGSPIHSTRILRFQTVPDDPSRSDYWSTMACCRWQASSPSTTLVVNCVLQQPDQPLMFATEPELSAFRSGTLIIDVACDEGMGFSWARPTSFAEPMFTLGANVNYYAVDHSPSHLGNAATWEISEALLPCLRRSSPAPMRGPATRPSDGPSKSAGLRVWNEAARQPPVRRTALELGRL